MSETAENYMDLIFGDGEQGKAPEPEPEPEAPEYPEHILALMKQKQDIQKKIDEWMLEEKTKKHLQTVIVSVQKKRNFNDFSPWEFTMSKKAKRIKTYLQEKITTIQMQEKKLVKARNKVKKEIEQQIKEYLEL